MLSMAIQREHSCRFWIKGSRAWIHRVFIIVMSLLCAHLKRVDLKFIFICLDLSLELFFISLTISSTFKWMETNATLFDGLVYIISLYLAEPGTGEHYNSLCAFRNAPSKTPFEYVYHMNLNPLQRIFQFRLSSGTCLDCLYDHAKVFHRSHSLLFCKCWPFSWWCCHVHENHVDHPNNHLFHHLGFFFCCSKRRNKSLPWYEFMNFPTMWATYFMVCEKCFFFSFFFRQESNNSNILWNNFDRLNLSGKQKTNEGKITKRRSESIWSIHLFVSGKWSRIKYPTWFIFYA